MKRFILVVAIFVAVAPVSFAQDTSTASSSSLLNTFEKSDAFLDTLGKSIPIYRDQVKVKFGGEFRYRFEFRDDFNFNDAAEFFYVQTTVKV